MPSTETAKPQVRCISRGDVDGEIDERIRELRMACMGREETTQPIVTSHTLRGSVCLLHVTRHNIVCQYVSAPVQQVYGSMTHLNAGQE